MKKLLGIVVLSLLLISCDQANNVSKKIENCSDNTIKIDFKNELSNYELNNTFFSKKISKKRNIERHKLIVQVLENEIKYLLSIENSFLDLKQKYTKGLDTFNLWHIRPLLLTNFEAKELLKADETELLNKRKRSRFFDNYEKTKDYFERKLRVHIGYINKFSNELNRFVVDGEQKFNDALETTLNSKKKSQNKFLKKKLEDKLQNSSYEKYFTLCEKRRSQSPIMFDEKWK